MGEDALRVGFAVLLMVFGVSALVGWTTASRNRLSLVCVGVAFIALGGGVAISSEGLAALRILLFVIAALAFLAGLWLAVAEVRRNMAAIQEQRLGLEREMHEYMTRLKTERGQEQDQPPSGAEQPPKADEGGPGEALR